MPRRKLSHLETRGGVFWVRVVVPRDLRQRLQRREWRFSLRTREPRVARLLCLEAALAIERVQAIARHMPSLTSEQIASVARAYFAWALKHACDAPKALSDGPIPIESDDEGQTVAQSVYQLADGDPESEREAVRARLARLRADLAAHKFDWMTRGLAAEFARDAGLGALPTDADGEVALLRAITRARVEEHRILLAQLEGNYADTAVHDPLFKNMELPLIVDWFARPKAKTRIASLREAAARYMNVKTKDGTWVKKTVFDNERVLSWLMELSGPDTPITTVSKDTVSAYRDALLDLPSNLVKLPEFKGKKLPEILSIVRGRKGDKRIAQHTAAKYFANLKAFFSWCATEFPNMVSPVGTIAIRQPRDAKEQRYPLSADQLRVLFSSPQYVGHSSSVRRHRPGRMIVRDGKFWIPLIGLYTGLRLGEIVQLLLADVKQIEGVWCLEVSRAEEDEHGPRKQIKTASSVRVVPIHPVLQQIGLIAHWETMRKAKGARLFPDIHPGKDGYYSHNFSKYFSRHLTYLRIKTKKTTFHSLRHNFSDACDRAGIPQQIKMALMGHADPSVSGRYGSRPTAELLFKNVEQIKYGLDLAHLYS